MGGLSARAQQKLVAAFVTGIGVATLAIAAILPEPMTSNVVGPRSAPYGVGLILTACGALLFLEIRRGGWTCEADETRPDISPMIILGIGMLASLALIKTTGFIIATTVMFIFTARAFGAQRLWVAALIGFGLAFATYFGFARLLDLRIGGGWIEDLL